MQKTHLVLPAYRLAMFDDASDATDKAAADKAAADKATADNAAAERATSDRVAADRAAADRAAADKVAADRAAADKRAADDERQRGKYESLEDYQRRISELNEENKTRRHENRELKTTLDVVQRRAIRADVLEAVRAAQPFNENASARIADMFMSDMGDAVKMDGKTGETVGLEKIAEWKKANPEFFKADETDAEKTVREAAEKKVADEKSVADRKRNATSAATSQGSGAGGGANTEGLPDLSKLKDPAERKQAIAAWKRGLNGAGAGGGYGRASAKR